VTERGPDNGQATTAARPTGDLAAVAAGFAGRLREVGVAASPERSVRFAAAVGLAQPRRLSELYWLARVTLVDDPGQLAAFDQEFSRLFGGPGQVADVADRRGDPRAPEAPAQRRPGAQALPPRAPGAPRTDLPLPAPAAAPLDQRAEGQGERNGDRLQMTASAEERLRHKDFAAYTPEELATLRRLVAAMRVSAPHRRTRRTARAPAGRRLDLRRTMRRARRTGGDPVRRDYRRRRLRPRRIVLIADVSGSMEGYSRVYLELLQGAVRGAGAEAFVMATRLTRVTGALSAGDPDEALARAAVAAPDWSGGTRIGAAVKDFLDLHGRRGMARGAVVVVVSDGWEGADPALLGEQVERLARLAHRVIWVNPRAAGEGYRPLAGGMAAALPHVDVLVSGHSLAALDELLDAIRHV
jgi:uncharacterized protein with von Willebrand factor type A (vWA) domain